MQTPPAAPKAPTAPSPPAPQGVTATTLSTPIVASNFSLDQLRARGRELSNQLNSAQGRRDELARDMRRASSDARPGLEQRINVLDQRLVQLETDIAANGKLIVQAAGDATRSSASSDHGPNFPGFGGMDVTPIAIVFTLFVLCPIALSAARLMWKRGNRTVATSISRDADLRMERVEQAVDAIAVEVERISEGQRFVTQLLSKASQAPALGVGQAPAEPIKVPMNETVMAGVQRKN